MKTKSLHTILCLLLLPVFFSCDKNFEEINTDPTQLSRETMKFEYLFTSAQVAASGNSDGYANGIWQAGLAYASTMMQHLSSTSTFWYGDKYVYNATYSGFYWKGQYTTSVKSISDVIENTRGKDEQKNLYNISRIFRCFLFQRLTDVYGDLPYKDAGKGYLSGMVNPAYDRQQDIYLDMFKELDQAASALDPQAKNTLGASDVFYQGDVAKWKKFAYSEMLRLALRLVKADAATGKTWAEKALAGGPMQSNSDNAYLPQQPLGTNPLSNPVGLMLGAREPNTYRLSQTFIDYLLQNNDPRLASFATVISDPTKTDDFGNSDPALQLGQPNGYDRGGSNTDVSNAPNWPGDQNKYSVVNRHTFSRTDAPTLLLSYAETELLLAEAVQRGWVSGSAATHYQNGLRAAFSQLNDFGANLTDADATAYLQSHAFDPAKGLEQINTQYWVVTFADWLETWANWRRSGFPVLKPVVYIGNNTNGTIPRRLAYPMDEANVNPQNYQKAVATLAGGDKITSRVWWDKP